MRHNLGPEGYNVTHCIDVEPPRLRCPANRTVASNEKLDYAALVWREPVTSGRQTQS